MSCRASSSWGCCLQLDTPRLTLRPDALATRSRTQDTHRLISAWHSMSCRVSSSWGYCSQLDASSLRLVASSRMISPNAKMSVPVVKWWLPVLPLAVLAPGAVHCLSLAGVA